MTVLSADTFNRTNSTTTLGSTDGAGSLDPRTWTTQTGTCGINSNQAYAPAVAAIATVDLATADVDVTVTLATIGTASALVFRFVDTSNYWMYHSAGGNTYLYKNIAGSFTQVDVAATGAADGDVHRVVANGSSIRVYRNGTLKITATDSALSSATKHGMRFSGTDSRLDSWSASSLGPELSTDTFNRTDSATTLGSTDGAGSLDPKAWVQIVGTWGINTNQGYSSALSVGRSIVYVDLATADVDLSITVPTFNGGASLMFRYSDNNNFWMWVYFDQLWKKVAGSFVAVGGTHAGGANGDTYRVVANGSSLTCYRNGSLLETQTDSFNSTATKHGMYTESTAARYDTWSASSISTTTTVTGTQATETDTGTSGTLLSVAAPTPVTPTLTYSLDTPSAATAAGYMVLG